MSKCLSTLVCALFTVSLLASGAQAATVFEKDGFTYKIKGDLQLQLRQAVGNDEELEVNYDDLELKNALSYDLGNDLTAFGELDFGFKDNAEDDGSPELEEAYLGFAYNSASILFGKTDSAADEFGIEGTIEGNECEVTAFPADNGDDLIRAEAEFEMATIVVTHELEAEGKDSQNGSFTDIFAGFEFAGFELGAAYQTYEENPDSDSIDTYGVSLGYDAEFIYVAADYSYGDYNTDELTVWNVFASAPVDRKSVV